MICSIPVIKMLYLAERVGFLILCSAKSDFLWLPEKPRTVSLKIIHDGFLYAQRPFGFESSWILLSILAERVGFEPTAPFGVTGFQDQLLKPLGHLSI